MSPAHAYQAFLQVWDALPPVSMSADHNHDGPFFAFVTHLCTRPTNTSVRCNTSWRNLGGAELIRKAADVSGAFFQFLIVGICIILIH